MCKRGKVKNICIILVKCTNIQQIGCCYIKGVIIHVSSVIVAFFVFHDKPVDMQI